MGCGGRRGDHGDMACILGQVEASRDNRNSNSNSNNSKARKNNQLKWQKAELTTACLKCARQSFLPACLPACQSCYSCCCCCGSEGRARRTPRSRAAKQPSSQEDAAQSTHRTPRMRLSLVYVFLNAMTTAAANKYQRADNDNDGHRRIGRGNGTTMRYPAVCAVTQVAEDCSTTKLR